MNPTNDPNGGSMDEIPEDIREAAIRCAETALRNMPNDYGDMTIEINAIARAILAERERCAKIADAFAAGQREINRKFPEHVKVYPSWENCVYAFERVAAAIRIGGHS
ncbi:MAG: hypothetical protein ABI216_18425 [Devosia sp.]